MKFKIYKTCVPGLRIIYDFITPEEEKEILDMIDKEEWSENQSKTRRVIFYGKRHTSKIFRVSENANVKEFPNYSTKIKKRIERLLQNSNTLPKTVYNSFDSELYVNEYTKNDRLYFHTDHRGTYEELIIGLSLCGDCNFSFQNIKTKEIKTAYIPKRSVYFMEGDSRYNMKHGILPNGILDERRISLTFRKIRMLTR